MAVQDIQALEPVYKHMREQMRPNPAIPDRRGPLVYDVSETPSLNGVQPEPQNEEGESVD